MSFSRHRSARLRSSIFHSRGGCYDNRPQTAARTKAGGIKGLLEVPQGSKDSPGEDKKELERAFIDEDVLLVL